MDQISDKTLLDANAKFADAAQIPQAVRVTTIKPTSWQIDLHQMKMFMSGRCPGVHPPFSKKYIRRIQVEVV